LLAAEVQAIAALHRSRFCLSSGITARRVGSAVEVAGFVQSQDQRDRLTGVLQTIGRPQLLRVRLTDPASALDVTAPAAATRVPVTSEKHVPPPIETWLRENLKVGSRITEREMFNLMNAVMRDSEDISSEAWALRHLAEQFPPERTRKLTPELLDQLLQILGDHALAWGNSLQLLQGRLRPLTGAATLPVIDAIAPQVGTHWQDHVVALQKLSEGAVSRLLASFSADSDTRDFSAVLTRVEATIQNCLASTGDLRTGIRTSSTRSAATPGHND